MGLAAPPTGVFVCVRVQFQRLAVQTVCCGWNPWALCELHTSEVESTVGSLNKGQRSSPKGSSNDRAAVQRRMESSDVLHEKKILSA